MSNIISNPTLDVSNILSTSGVTYVDATPTWNPDLNPKEARIAIDQETNEVWLWDIDKAGAADGAWVLYGMVARQASAGIPSYTPTNLNELVIDGEGDIWSWNPVTTTWQNSSNGTIHTHEVQAVPYTGTELPTTAGVSSGDTNVSQFNNRKTASYTYNGTIWVLNFVETNTIDTNIVGVAAYNPALPLTGWTAPAVAILGDTASVKFTDGTIGSYTYNGTAWVLNFIGTVLPAAASIYNSDALAAAGGIAVNSTYWADSAHEEGAVHGTLKLRTV